MKTLTYLTILTLVSVFPALAQTETVGASNNSVSSVTPNSRAYVAHDVTGFSDKNAGPGVTKESINRPPDMHPNLKPQPGGVITDTVKYGPELYSPAAPASLGYGARYLSAPDPRADLPHETGRAAHRDSGGIKLFSLEF